MNNQSTYKRTKSYGWIVLLFLLGFYVWMIFAYIHQWGNNPISKAGLIILGIIIFVFFIVSMPGRFYFKIDDQFVTCRLAPTDVFTPLKINISQIKDVSVGKVSFWRVVMFRGHQFDFTGQVVRIQMKSGNVYQISIRNAEQIKEEIEKRMSESKRNG